MESKDPDETLRIRGLNLNPILTCVLKDTFSLGSDHKVKIGNQGEWVRHFRNVT